MARISFPLLLLSLLCVSQLSSAKHCKYELAEPGQMIDIEKSKKDADNNFKEVGAIHVDGATEEIRLKECIEVCCHAGEGCNVVTLDVTITGEDGDNCGLYRCDPPEKCAWKLADDMQSAIINDHVTTMAPTSSALNSTATTPATTTDTTQGVTKDATESTSSTTDATTTTTQSQDATAETSTSSESTETTATASDVTTSSSDTTDATSTTTDATSTTTVATANVTAATNSSDDAQTDSVTATVSSTEERNTETTQAPTTQQDQTQSTTPSSDSSDNNATADFVTTEAPLNTEISSSNDTSDNVTDDGGNFLPSVDNGVTGGNGTTNSTLAGTTYKGGMSKFTITSLTLALAAGIIFIGVISTVVGKRVYDNWHRRHYQQIDYLVDGLYG